MQKPTSDVPNALEVRVSAFQIGVATVVVVQAAHKFSDFVRVDLVARLALILFPMISVACVTLSLRPNNDDKKSAYDVASNDGKEVSDSRNPPPSVWNEAIWLTTALKPRLAEPVKPCGERVRSADYATVER